MLLNALTRQVPLLGSRLTPVKSSHAIIGTSRRAIAIALTLWCAGAGCMIVSYAHGAMTADDSAAAQSHGLSVASASMSNHACCKAHHSSAKRNHTSSGSESS